MEYDDDDPPTYAETTERHQGRIEGQLERIAEALTSIDYFVRCIFWGGLAVIAYLYFH